ncbi:ABC transporter substrate-binding protein [Agrococcus jejuensis]|uniref:Peptide/nickel transport system substrate-binding protein n=1 Tax=Agrococcus jejuensis TaxID=399736 RepID=A0A1G8C946_9MICO|nr:ABC transporter substrate-binding protein [Agrococcus jejuensis]SDH41420.1 peptide/nickel transport system substrate-binding protein [Agrococcus jejuensis]
MISRRWVAAAAALAVTVGVAGCSDGGGAAQGGDVLTIGMPNGTQTNNQNPFTGTSSALSLGYAWAMYEPLVQVNPVDFTADPEPWLASAYEWNDDYTAFTFTAREDVTWSDGEDFTADDIAFTAELLRDAEGLNTAGLPYDQVTVDGDAVTITFTEPQFVNRDRVLSMIVVPEHIWSEIDDPATELNQEPVGTGPYTLSSWTSQAAILDVNPEYWGGEPAVPQLRYTSYTDNNALTTALSNGEVQWGWTFIADIESVYVANDPEHLQYWAAPGLAIDALFLNTQAAPFDDLAVRQALNMVIDRDVISAQATSDLFPPVTNPTGIAQPVGDPFLAPEYLDATLSVDVEGARDVLEAAGYTWDASEQLLDPSGEAVTFTITNPSGWNDYLTADQLIVDAASQLGMSADVDATTVDGWMEAIGNGDFQAMMHWTETGSTPYEVYANVMGGQYLQPMGEQATWNFGRFDDASAAEALQTYATSSDEAAQTAALATLQQVFVDQVPAIPIVVKPFAAEYSTLHWEGWPDESNPYAQPQPTGTQVSRILMELQPAGD